jgi:regulator of RNase E activity RraA
VSGQPAPDEYADVVAAARSLTTCHLSDAMDRFGIRHGALVGIRPMEPARAAVGLAFTVRIAQVGQAAAAGTNYLDHLTPGSFVVLAAGGRIDCSVWGGNRTLAALEHGSVAAVVDGAYRDVDEHRALGFPVFGLAPTPAAGRGRVLVAEHGGPVTACGITVEPGDLVAGDASGVVVVPRRDMRRVVERAAEIAAQEDIAGAVSSVTAR